MNDTLTRPFLTGERVLLRLAEPGDGAMLLAFHQRNEAFLAPYDPPRPEGFWTEDFWEHYIEQAQREFAVGASCRFLVLPQNNPGMVCGKVNLSQISRGPFQACIMGYAVDEAMQGKGMMRESVSLVIEHAFTTLGLHRIMANYLPTNERSGGLLKRLGFSVEGYARDYLYINGTWRDHILTSLVNSNWSGEIWK